MFKPQYQAAFIGGNPTQPPSPGLRPPSPSGRGEGEGKKGERRGYSLLLAVLITSTVLSAASALATIIISEIRQTRQTAGAIQARASAEQKTERVLYLLRKTELPLDQIAGATGAAVSSSQDPQYFSIQENDFVSLPISVDGEVSDIAPRITTITTWKPAEACASASASWIEVTPISWNGAEFISQRYPYSHSDFTSEGQLRIAFPAGGTPVEMRIRALYCDIDNLAVEDIPGRVRIVASGQSGDVSQSLQTLMVRRPPASGLFDFVIFSESEIKKGL
ncbi:hypothetical protein A3D58_02020 [Candidatus Uhrbacteria bacterium RIFCSPHIGHO2_02_FULL_46_47]|nr:MAG: hypothetical protein A2753_04445 [Candidatus Uhrbacteria bacterium RIFCSPHIGHO2_01_FULL_47_11]OGL68664.1 MAG: hypothetical protein A3D58_02020 [Candidatus Uhrbacteria bacterium RIFCSPHIGHO2_02_FULL_46_47]